MQTKKHLYYTYFQELTQEPIDDKLTLFLWIECEQSVYTQGTSLEVWRQEDFQEQHKKTVQNHLL